MGDLVAVLFRVGNFCPALFAPIRRKRAVRASAAAEHTVFGGDPDLANELCLPERKAETFSHPDRGCSRGEPGSDIVRRVSYRVASSGGGGAGVNSGGVV